MKLRHRLIAFLGGFVRTPYTVHVEVMPEAAICAVCGRRLEVVYVPQFSIENGCMAGIMTCRPGECRP